MMLEERVFLEMPEVAAEDAARGKDDDAGREQHQPAAAGATWDDGKTPYNCGTCGKVNRLGDAEKFICGHCGGRVMFKRPLENNPFARVILAR